ncbi:hypothetical protein F8M41_017194 [Gigaspora margarita]|uniref:F-box domain-containing protein n=1 Tax=Gigaspora margarita TaxID=4874 RepID=A0A8H4EUC0_GIGMA|nr:hypothetical protein F8M41_017194 [Gigaspora margarita]
MNNFWGTLPKNYKYVTHVRVTITNSFLFNTLSMASKIFIGDMPELMENILNNLNNEIYSLYSCALVSRHWCKMSIPILWQDPFSFEQDPLFITKYFSSLGEDEKFVLKECGINAEFPKTLFDYARFLKVLDLSSLESKVRKWIDFQFSGSRTDYNQSVYRIINLLLKLFVESGATLHKLNLYFLDYEIKPEIFHALGRNEQSFSRLQNLSLSIVSEFSTDNTAALLKILAKNATKISSLKFNGFCSDYDEPQLFHAFISMIKSQEQLKQFSLVCEDYLTEFHGIISTLESQKNSLQEVILENCACSVEFEILKDCKKLEIVRIKDCDYPKLLKLLNCKINILELVDFQINASAIVQILEKSGLLLQRLKLESDEGIWEELLLLETLRSFCPNITYLNISYIGFSTQLLELIGNLQKLQFLSLWCVVYSIPKNELKIRVKRFAEMLSPTLQYLDLSINIWLKPYIDILLNHCNAPLKKLLISHLDSKKNSKALVEFCRRNNTLNYVGVDRYFSLKDNIKKEVEAYVTLVPPERIIVNC